MVRIDVTPRDHGAHVVPSPLRDRLVVYTLHDGTYVPRRVLDELASPHDAFSTSFHRQRDWGASLVAHHLAAELGLDAYHQVQVARAVMDFNRFPGVTPRRTGPTEDLAISSELGQQLTYDTKRWILEHLYDGVSDAMDAAIAGKLVLLSIHTYDAHNATETVRPEVSLLSRSQSYQTMSHLPHGLFDPLFPSVLAESSVTRILRDRMALTLEKAGLNVEHNYPYCLPDGSLEIRSQPWLFFQAVRENYEARFPHTRDDQAHALVWHMLLNTNQRDAESRAFHGYLHTFRDPLPGRRADFEAARHAYDRIAAHLASDPHFVHAHRYSEERTSAMTIEVRKDLVWHFEDGVPKGPKEDGARRVAAALAKGIRTYLVEDREGR
jgi:hypothetical protein